jgi:AcrR family transcriptional regulator
MTVRRTPSHLATRRRILDAARALVVEHGWDSFSLRGLARAVDLSPASLYEYFDGKDAILEGVADRARKRLVDRLRSVPSNAPDRSVELAMAYIDFARSEREDFLLLYGRTSEAGEAPGKGSPYAIWLNQLARESDGTDLHARAYGVWACAHGLAMLQVTELAGVEGDFAASDRRTIQALVAGM